MLLMMVLNCAFIGGKNGALLLFFDDDDVM